MYLGGFYACVLRGCGVVVERFFGVVVFYLVS